MNFSKYIEGKSTLNGQLNRGTPLITNFLVQGWILNQSISLHVSSINSFLDELSYLNFKLPSNNIKLTNKSFDYPGCWRIFYACFEFTSSLHFYSALTLRLSFSVGSYDASSQKTQGKGDLLISRYVDRLKLFNKTKKPNQFSIFETK